RFLRLKRKLLPINPRPPYDGWIGTAPAMAETRSGSRGPRVFAAILCFFLFVSAVYLFAFPQPNVFYAGIVLAHALAGVLATVLLIPALWRAVRSRGINNGIAWLLLLAGATIGLWLIHTGTPRPQWKWLYAHILLSTAGVGTAFAVWWGKRTRLGAV